MDSVVASWFGVAGSTVMLVGVLLSIQGFSGMKKERFSFLNHFISELGDPRFARHNKLFAATLISSGILMIPFVLGLGLFVGTVMNGILICNGLFSTINCIFVGVFPEHKIKQHLIVSGCFFVGMAILVLFFSITICVQPVSTFPVWVVIPSGAFLVAPVSFLVNTARLDKVEFQRTSTPWEWENGRPRFWLNPFLEWCAFFSLLGWLFMVVIMSFF